MAATFTRVNAVVVDLSFAKGSDAYLDAGFAAGTYNANLAVENNPVASQSVLYRGMPVALASATGGIVPISQVTVPASTSAGTYYGVLLSDITPYVVNRGTKIGVARSGRVRTYAGGTLAIGDPVKPDIASAFGGFVKWVAASDAAELRVGHAFPINDGSNGAAPSISMAQGDIIFVDLI